MAQIKVSFAVALFIIIIAEALMAASFLFLVSGIAGPAVFSRSKIQIPSIEKIIPNLEAEVGKMIDDKESFILVDLNKMAITLYSGGSVKNQFPILRRGNPDNWGGTPLGKYAVITKNLSSFSNSAKVYMPQAINFYGRYFIHGEPYYPSGKKLITNFSGGCVQLSDKHAGVIYKFAEIGMPVIVTDDEADVKTEPVDVISKSFPAIDAKAYLVADIDSGLIIASKKIDERLSIASLTKLMTAVVASENTDIENRSIVTKEALSIEGQTKGLDAGKRIRIIEILYPLMVESSDDAAEVLGAYLGRDKMITLMNEKAGHLLMENTIFTDLSGLNPEDVSSAKDMYRLIRYVEKARPPLLKITKGERNTPFGVTPFPVLKNKNIFYDNNAFIGGKTGYSESTGYTGSFVFEFKEGDASRRIVIVILGTDNYLGGDNSLKGETEAIIEWLKNEYFASNAKAV